MSFHLNYFIESLEGGIQYIPTTLRLSFIVFIVSVFLAFVIATIRFYRVPVISQILAFFVTVYMGIPNMLALNVYYLILTLAFPVINEAFNLGIPLKDVNYMIVVYVTMILSESNWISEDFRGAYKAIDPVQFEAAYSIGETKIQTLRRIIFPQILPVVFPNLMNWLTGTVKNMSLISAIGLIEVMGGALKPCGRTYSYLEGYVAAALIYWALVAIIERIGNVIDRKSKKYRREIAS